MAQDSGAGVSLLGGPGRGPGGAGAEASVSQRGARFRASPGLGALLGRPKHPSEGSCSGCLGNQAVPRPL